MRGDVFLLLACFLQTSSTTTVWATAPTKPDCRIDTLKLLRYLQNSSPDFYLPRTRDGVRVGDRGHRGIDGLSRILNNNDCFTMGNLWQKRGPGSEFLGKRSPGSEFLGKRISGSEFLGKRISGSEFLGKRHHHPDLPTMTFRPAEMDQDAAEEAAYEQPQVEDYDDDEAQRPEVRRQLAAATALSGRFKRLPELATQAFQSPRVIRRAPMFPWAVPL